MPIPRTAMRFAQHARLASSPPVPRQRTCLTSRSWTALALLSLLLIASLIPLSCNIASAQGQQELGDAVGKYQLGNTAAAIEDLEHLLGSLNYDSDKVRFVQVTRTLLDLYWRTEDPAAIRSVLTRAGAVLQNREHLDTVDIFLTALVELYRVRERLLSRDLGTARQLGVNLLGTLETLPAEPYHAIRLQLLLTLAIASRAEFRLSEADSYMHQALGLALQDDQIAGASAFDLVESLLQHYVESGEYQYAALIFQQIRKAPAVLNTVSHQSIDGFSLDLLLAETRLQGLTIGAPEPPALVDLLLLLERTERDVQEIPQHLRIRLHAALVYLEILRHDTTAATRAFSSLDALYRTDPTALRDVANVLAWAAYHLHMNDAAARYASNGHSDPTELNLFLYPLNQLVAASLDRDAGHAAEAVRDTKEAFGALIKNIAARGIAEPTAAISLSYVERGLLVELIGLALDLSSSGPSAAPFTEEVSIAVQLLQRDRIPKGAIFAPGLLVAPTANVEEHLRAREHLAQARYRAVQEAVRILLERAGSGPGQTPSKQPDWGERNRFFEYAFRVNALDDYLHSVLYNQKDFLLGLLALVPPGDLQPVLRQDEALISHVRIAPGRLLIECLTRDTIHFSSVSFDATAFDSHVRLLNLSVAASHGPSLYLDSQYPAVSAVAIFDTLFAPAETCLRGKTQLIIATEPALLGVPFNALLTGMPSAAGEGYDLRHAPWMIRQWAVSVSLARSTLLYQRTRPSLARPRRPFLAFGNPRFEGSASGTRFVDPRSVYDARGAAQGDALRALPALPETASELTTLRSYLGEHNSALFLGPDATERNVRSQDLDDYRIVAFATHGLTAGEFDSLAEPALALTPGDTQDSRNDGLLRMSEISRLWIPADLVILSACNTAAGDGTPNATGFSGLVNAFFFAGARAVLASQWPVASDMAAPLTTGMFSALSSTPGLPLSVALQRAMLRIVDESDELAYAHPRFWAPFLVAGDGVAPAAAIESLSTPTKPLLAIKWDRNLGETLAGEILAVATGGNNSANATGYTEPKNGRAQSIVVAFDRDGNERWRVDDPVVAAGSQLLRYTDDRIAAAGYVWSNERYEGAVLRAFDNRTGFELWRKVFDTPDEDHTLGLLPAKGEHLLWVIGSQPDARERKDPHLTITLLTLDQSGAVVATRSQDLKGDAFRLFSGAAVTRWRGHVLLAWTASKTTGDVQAMFGAQARDLATGYYSPACTTQHSTRLIELDESTGRIVRDNTILDTHVKRFAIAPDARLLAAADVWSNCLGQADAAVIEVLPDLSARTIFRYGGPLAKAAGDITVLPDGKVVLVGSVTPVFDLDPYVKVDLSNRTSSWPVFTGELFQNDRKTASAFIVMLDRDGNFLGDRIFRDLRGRVLRAVAAHNDGSILFGGLANGVSSWLGTIDPK